MLLNIEIWFFAQKSPKNSLVCLKIELWIDNSNQKIKLIKLKLYRTIFQFSFIRYFCTFALDKTIWKHLPAYYPSTFWCSLSFRAMMYQKIVLCKKQSFRKAQLLPTSTMTRIIVLLFVLAVAVFRLSHILHIPLVLPVIFIKKFSLRAIPRLIFRTIFLLSGNRHSLAKSPLTP